MIDEHNNVTVILFLQILIVRANTWKIIINHAQMCKDDNGIYLYYYPRDGHNGVVFNISGQLVGLIAESQFVPCDKLPRDKKVCFLYLILVYSFVLFEMKYNPN